MNQKKILPVTGNEFRRFGRIVTGFDLAELVTQMKTTPLPDSGTVYTAMDPKLEKLPVAKELEKEEFGGLPIQIGYCNGHNEQLNALEYHRSSELNLAVTDLILLVGSRADVDPVRNTFDTSATEAFRVPAGTMVELYATTLHYAPCGIGGAGFRDAVILPRGTNLPLEQKPSGTGEARLLFARNKWLIAHPDSGLQKEGAFVGLTGENIDLSSPEWEEGKES